MRKTAIRIAAGLFLAAVALFTVTAGPTDNLTSGKVDLKSAGALAFGPDGILFIGDSVAGSVVAIDTNDRTPARGASKIDVQGIDVKIASLVGVAPDQDQGLAARCQQIRHRPGDAGGRAEHDDRSALRSGRSARSAGAGLRTLRRRFHAFHSSSLSAMRELLLASGL